MGSRKRKTWLDYGIHSDEYETGLRKFVKHAFENTPSDDRTIACPCRVCVRYYRHNEEEVFEHLVLKGPMRDFEKWYSDTDFVCSSITMDDDSRNTNIGDYSIMREMVEDAYRNHSIPLSRNDDSGNQEQPDVEMGGDSSGSQSSHLDIVNNLLQDAELELYPGCKNYSKLSFILHLYRLKCASGMSDKCFGELLEIFKKALPEGTSIPDSPYEAKKIVDGLSLKYEKIDACPNDCMLYWKENINANECNVCGVSRWKPSSLSSSPAEEADGNETTSKIKKKRIPAKVVRYFPLKPRLQRLFMSSKTAELMRWHANRKKEEGVLKHPADSEAWENLDSQDEQFAVDPRSVRLGLASDGFNPFAENRTNYSSWPVILTIYNLPPELCMKKPYFILSTLVPGPKAPGNNIDIYLQPLIEELKQLWVDGVETYDAFSKETFKLKAALLWTINDFPAYGNLSGWCVYGRKACPYCNNDTWSKRYKNSGKFCYMGHRRFLDEEHKYRYDERSFDNTREPRPPPNPPTGSDVLKQLQHITFTLGKTTQNDLSGVKPKTWKKKSIFFELPYWEKNLLRHNLDVMHIEKNVCDNITNTLLNDPKKTKDNLKAREVLREIGVRKHLWPQQRANGRKYLPAAPYNLDKDAKDRFCEVLRTVRFPDGYASNVSRCVLQRKLSGLKSHDCHVLMQLLLPLAMRESLNEKVASVLMELCNFFEILCSKSLSISELDKLKPKIAVTLCNMEMIFPPTFFTISMHLVAHLADEAKIGGPVHYRWMYPIERYLSTLKSYVRNKAHVEGSIAETYLVEECLAFCSQYLEADGERTSGSSTKDLDSNDVENSQESSLFPSMGKPYGRVEGFMMTDKIKAQAHRYVLFNANIDEIESLKEEHISYLKRVNRRSRPSQHVLHKMHCEEFVEWLKLFVNDPDNKGDKRITEDVKSLAMGPMPVARRFYAFDLNNGYRFRTRDYEMNRKTQNCGVIVVAKTPSYASTKDKHPVTGDVTYYGILTDIIELNYYNKFKVVMFKCDWADINHCSGLKKDQLGFTMVNFSHPIHTGDRLGDEPFVFASQVDQVIFVQDITERDWFIPKLIKPRGTYDLGDDGLASVFNDNSRLVDNVDINVNDLSSVSTGVEGVYVD